MAIFKALLGGIIGGGVGALLANMIPGQWPVLLAGLLAGLGVRLCCGNQRNFMTGVVAAVAAILMVVGTSYSKSMATIRDAENFQPVLTMPAVDDDAEEADEEEEEEAADDAVEEAAEEAEEIADDVEEAEAEVAVAEAIEDASAPLVGGEGMAEAMKPADAAEFTTEEAVYHGLSALLAYLLGTGSAVAAVGKPESPGDGEQA